MNKIEIKDKINNIVNSLDLAGLDLNNMDSLDKLEFIMKLEDEFSVELKPEEFLGLSDINDIVILIESKISDGN